VWLEPSAAVHKKGSQFCAASLVYRRLRRGVHGERRRRPCLPVHAHQVTPTLSLRATDKSYSSSNYRRPMSETFAGLLRRYRREAALSQEALAERAALSKDAVSALERGARRAPYRDTVELLTRALQLDDAGRREFEAAAARGRAERLQPVPEETHPSNLPQMGTTLVGRDEAVDAVLERLAQNRIVTVAGTGGIGKTRVALDTAERFVQTNQTGVWFADLAAVTRGASVVSNVASAAGVKVVGSDGDLDQLTTALHEREGLIILDNCEHVIDDAAKTAAAIAVACPALKVLATSRQRLALRGESLYHLGALGTESARELFTMRASSAGLTLTDSDKSAVDEICRDVDNIPLAIELAAARAPQLGLSELHARLQGQLTMLSGGLRDAPARQRAMQETLTWSYDLLDQTERAVFRRLAVFAGGWALDAIALVALATPVESNELLPAFTSLVEKSLVTADLEIDPVRYRLLEPVRTFSMERLRAAGELQVGRERHAHWVADFATTFAQSEAESYTPAAIAAALRELDNARAALEWSLQPLGDVVVGARIVGGMRACWLTTGLHAECRRWCELILTRLDVDAHPAIAAAVFRALVDVTGRADKQLDVILRALPVFERAGDWSRLVTVHSLLGARYAEAGRLDEAQRTFERVEAIRRERHLESNAGWITVLMHRGYLFRLKSQFEEAAAVLDEAAALARKLQRPFQGTWALLLSAEMAFALGERDEAITLATEALAKSVTYRYVNIEVLARSNLAGYYIAAGDAEQARAQARGAISLVGNVEANIMLAAILHLATAAAISGAQRDAARLQGYCDARYAERKTMKDPSEIASGAMLTSALEACLSADEIAELARQGAKLEDGEAAKLAASVI